MKEGSKRVNVWMMRHGISTFNEAFIQNKENKYSPEFIDAPLSEKGIEQTRESQELVNKLDIKYVFVSPFLRTLETAKYVMENHPNLGKLKAIVHPLIKESLKCSCDVISSIEPRIKEFSSIPGIEFDFGPVLERGNNFTYWLQDLEVSSQIAIKHSLHLIPPVIPQELEFNLNILKLMKEKDPQPFESETNVHKRLDNFILFLQDYLGNILKKEGENAMLDDILIITHINLCKLFTATEFDEDGKAKEGCYILADNCQIFNKELYLEMRDSGGCNNYSRYNKYNKYNKYRRSLPELKRIIDGMGAGRGRSGRGRSGRGRSGRGRSGSWEGSLLERIRNNKRALRGGWKQLCRVSEGELMSTLGILSKYRELPQYTHHLPAFELSKQISDYLKEGSRGEAECAYKLREWRRDINCNTFQDLHSLHTSKFILDRHISPGAYDLPLHVHTHTHARHIRTDTGTGTRTETRTGTETETETPSQKYITASARYQLPAIPFKNSLIPKLRTKIKSHIHAPTYHSPTSSSTNQNITINNAPGNTKSVCLNTHLLVDPSSIFPNIHYYPEILMISDIVPQVAHTSHSTLVSKSLPKYRDYSRLCIRNSQKEKYLIKLRDKIESKRKESEVVNTVNIVNTMKTMKTPESNANVRDLKRGSSMSELKNNYKSTTPVNLFPGLVASQANTQNPKSSICFPGSRLNHSGMALIKESNISQQLTKGNKVNSQIFFSKQHTPPNYIPLSPPLSTPNNIRQRNIPQRVSTYQYSTRYFKKGNILQRNNYSMSNQNLNHNQKNRNYNHKLNELCQVRGKLGTILSTEIDKTFKKSHKHNKSCHIFKY